MKNVAELESRLDRILEKVFSHPAFLTGVCTLINLNSYRKLWINRGLTQAWKALQLPNKRDQERTLHLINELHHRISELEEILDLRKRNAPEMPNPAHGSVAGGRMKKARTDAEVFSIQ